MVSLRNSVTGRWTKWDLVVQANVHACFGHLCGPKVAYSCTNFPSLEMQNRDGINHASAAPAVRTENNIYVNKLFSKVNCNRRQCALKKINRSHMVSTYSFAKLFQWCPSLQNYAVVPCIKANACYIFSFIIQPHVTTISNFYIPVLFTLQLLNYNKFYLYLGSLLDTESFLILGRFSTYI